MRITYIDGMRGLAAMAVLSAHVIGAFYPVLIPTPQVLPLPLNELASYLLLIRRIIFTPLTIFYNGFSAVTLFLLLSGYVIYNSCVYNKDKTHLTPSVFKRYFRLTIPTLFSCLLSYSLLKFSLFANFNASQVSQSPWLSNYFVCESNFLAMIKFVFYDQYFNNNFEELRCYNTVLWMMGSMLLGSLLVYAFYVVFNRVSYKLKVVLYIILIILFHKSLMLAIILGMMLCDIDTNKMFQNVNKIALYIILIVGIYLASFIRSDLPFYRILDMNLLEDHFGNFLPFFFYIIGTFLYFFAVSRLPFLKGFFSKKLLLYLGKLSFSIYLFHFIIICSLSSYIYIWLRYFNNFSYNISFFIAFAITLIVTILLSHLFYKYIELRSINISNLIYKYIDRYLPY